MARPMRIRGTRLEGGFWADRLETVRTRMIPYQLETLESPESGCLRNFRIASGKEEGAFTGWWFQDTDAYKWLEAAAYSLMRVPDKELEAKADSIIDLIVSAQEEDGYLDTYYSINGLEGRFSDLAEKHELYCLGHLSEAAAAYFMATGKRKLLDAALSFIDCVDRNIGPEEGKKHGYPGHEELEMALIRVYALTGDERHRRLASYFIRERGKSPLYFEKEKEEHGRTCQWADSALGYQYYQAGKSVIEQDKAEGHAVRALYLCSGIADVAAADGDEELFAVAERLWDNITKRQLYITGQVGAQHYGESFSFDYNLPNDAVYGETCASIALAFFACRMFLQTEEGKYMDTLETALYNTILSGMSLSGTEYFYVNPLEVEREEVDKLYALRETEYRRQEWFGCACCPPNLARFLSSLPSYAYSRKGDVLFINLYMSSEAGPVSVRTGYPWDGRIEITTRVKGDYTLALRLPSWAEGRYKLTLNGEDVKAFLASGYLYLPRRWVASEKLVLTLPMEVRVMEANPLVREDIGKVALQRGPIVYCLEEADNGPGLWRLSLSPEPEAEAEWEDILGGVMTIKAKGRRLRLWEGDELYAEASEPRYERVTLKFIPYFAWANRAPGDMSVWIRR